MSTGQFVLGRRMKETIHLLGSTSAVITVIGIGESSVRLVVDFGGVAGVKVYPLLTYREPYVLPDGTELHLNSVDRGKVRIMVKADRSVRVLRGELLERSAP